MNGQNYYTAITRARYGVKLWTEDRGCLVAKLEAAPRIRAVLAGMGCGSVPVLAPVVIPDPEPVASAPAPVPLPVRAGAPDLPFDLRQRFGLQ